MQQQHQHAVDYLPAIYQENGFLETFLRPFEDVLTGFDDLLSDIDRYFTPALTDKEFLPWLSGWVALVLDEEWDEAKRRKLIAEAAELYRWRGTVRGLKRYLEIYTGLQPEIREWHWPGGMQIGVASRIGWFDPDLSRKDKILSATQKIPIEYKDYYVVDTQEEINGKQQLVKKYYRVDHVASVQVGADELGPFVIIDHLDLGAIKHAGTVTRRDHLIDEEYDLLLETDGGEESTTYYGDTVLVDELGDLPYRFIVDVRVPIDEVENIKFNKVRAIVDLEKPAHTAYYLKLSTISRDYVLLPMQIGERSSIGVDTELM